VNGGGFCCDDSPKLRAGAIGNGNDNPEIFQYYYHSDHLGSTSLITDLDGNVVQHVEYVPFGEVFIEERNNKWNTPYLFNAKELDEETGLYYYGARYYDGRVSVWLGVDPLAEKYPNKTPYHFCSNNPINFVDPDGKDDYLDTEGNKIYNDGEGNGLRLVDKEVFKSLEKEVNKSMRSMKFVNANEKRQYKQQQLRDKLRNGTNEDKKPNSREITINYDEFLPDGYNSTIDFIYDVTNNRSLNPNGKNEYFVNIVLDIEKAVISFSPVGKINRESGRIAIRVGSSIMLANIHGHPDQLENRAEGAFHTLGGESESDKNAARNINGPVYSIEKNNIYYYTPRTYTSSPDRYTGGRDARSIISHAINIKVNQ
jgi:RHS repeat-associated protein